MRFDFFLAYRFLRGTDKEKQLSFMVKLCFISIAIGSFSLALVLSIAHGFEKATHQKIQGVHADGFIRAQGKPLNYDTIKTIIEHDFSDLLKAISPQDSEQVIIAHEVTESLGQSVTLKGIEPNSFTQISNFESYLQGGQGKKRLSELLAGNSILIGAPLAEQFSLAPGDEATLLFADYSSLHSLHEKKLSFDSATAQVTGIFKTGIEELDEHLVICSQTTLSTLIDRSTVTEIGFSLTAHGKRREKQVVAQLQKRFASLEVSSWKELYKPLVAALALERYALMLILGLISIVASMNMISLLTLFINHKRKSIALCSLMGMSTSQLRVLFITIGTSLGAIASATGVFFSFCTALFLQSYPLIQLPDAYYLTSLPVDLNPLIFIGVFLATTLLSCITSSIPARTLGSVPLGTILKKEE